MRIGLVVMAVLYSIPNLAFAQQWQTVFHLDSRLGYSSNTYLNPYFSEWDRSVGSGYGTLTATGQTTWFDDNNVADFTGSAVFEPFFGESLTWKGGLAYANYQRKITDKVSAGIETGGSYFSSTFERSLLWAQPTLSWFPSPFTNIKLKAGSNLREYKNYTIDSLSVDSKQRVDLYALEFTTWPSFNWQLSAGLYGGLDTLPTIGEGFRSTVSAAHIFNRGEILRFTFGLEQYQNQITATYPGGGGGGFPNTGPPSGSSEIIQQTDQIFRVGIEGTYPVSDQLSLFLNVDGLQYQSDVVEEDIQDIQVSGGLRFSLEPSRLGRQKGIQPEWEKDPTQQQVMIQFAGEGQLYLIGDFNNWKRPGIPLVEQEENRYLAELNLDMGTYEYKVLKVNGGKEEWITFSDNTFTVDDGYGGENAMLLIEQ